MPKLVERPTEPRTKARTVRREASDRFAIHRAFAAAIADISIQESQVLSSAAAEARALTRSKP